jgi:hypothetical protein
VAGLTGLAGAAGVAVLTLLTGCGSAGAQPAPAASATPQAAAPPARARLAAAAAAAADLRAVSFYTLRTPDRDDRTVTVIRAAGAGWRVDIPGGALGGTADVTVARTPAGLFQCGPRGADRPEVGCVRVDRLTGGTDPRVQHVFADWLDVLRDRAAALAVAAAEPLSEVDEACYAVEPSAASLLSPVDAGIYCFRADGTLTGARLGFGTLVLSDHTPAAPPEIDLPGPVVEGEPLPTAPPPSPSPSSPSLPATTPSP